MDAEAPDERAQRIAAALAEGGAEEREAAYAAVEAAVRGAPQGETDTGFRGFTAFT